MTRADDSGGDPSSEGPAAPRMDLDFDERDGDQGRARPDDRAALEPSLDSEPAPTMDGEPVSMRELEMIFAPGVVPPPMMGSTPQRRAPPPLPPARRPATGTPLPRPRDDRLSDLQTMAALNPRPKTDSDPPDSRARDLQSMSIPGPRKDADKRVDDEVLMLSGGLFDSPLTPLLSPDIALAPPPLSELTTLPASEPPSRRSSSPPGKGKKKSAKRSGKSSRPPAQHKRTLAPTSVSSAGDKKKDAVPQPTADERGPAPARWLVPTIAAAALVGGFLILRGRSDPPEAPVDPVVEQTPTAPDPSVDHGRAPAQPAPENEPTESEREVEPPPPDAVAAPGPMPQPPSPEATQPSTGSSADPSPAQPPKTTEPAPSALGPFDKSAASVAMSSAAASASGCRSAGDPTGVARVTVTFAPSGRATTANVSGPPFAGTATGGCIAKVFRQASIQPFAGDPVTVSKTVTIH